MTGMDKLMISRLKILVADQPYMAGLTATMLRTLSVKSITEVNDVAGALGAVHRDSFGLILVDESLGPTDALDFVRMLRQDETCVNRDIPVLMTFTHAEKARVLAARDAGITEVLIKPLSANVIGLRLAQTLANPRPFGEAPAYAGPDRRRKTSSAKGPERRKDN